MKTAILLLYCIAFATFSFSQGLPPPRSGYVPDSATAVKIAEAVLIPVYGKEHIESERPFTAELNNGVWTVAGTLRCSDGKGGITTRLCVGGVATVKISKSDARVLFMIHYK
jgi:hypothetical protein